MFEGSFLKGKAPRKHLLRAVFVFSFLLPLCMPGGDTKRIAEYDFDCASWLPCPLQCGLPVSFVTSWFGGSVAIAIFEGSFVKGKVPRKHLLPAVFVFSALLPLCMPGGDTKRIGEYYFDCAS